LLIEKQSNVRIKELVRLYEQTSKHSNYQILPSQLQELIPSEQIHVKTRYEKERMSYIKKKIDWKDSCFCDIGCNCGFFSFEALELGAKKGTLYEGNQVHADFVKLAAKILNVESQITVHNDYFSFEWNTAEKYDVVLLLNVLHHIGDDYGNVKSIDNAKDYILKMLKCMTSYTNKLIVQLGFNWMGNRTLGLFKGGTKEEMIRWIKEGTKDNWVISSIGIACEDDGKICYRDLNEDNVKRNDEMGEFLNRPIFIMDNVSMYRL